VKLMPHQHIRLVLRTGEGKVKCLGGRKKVCRYRATVVLYRALPATRGQLTSEEGLHNSATLPFNRYFSQTPKRNLYLTPVVPLLPTLLTGASSPGWSSVFPN
jgi:hypothetical protein